MVQFSAFSPSISNSDLGGQFPIALSSVALVLAAVVEVAVCSAAGAYLGFLYGSSVGELSCASCAALAVTTSRSTCREGVALVVPLMVGPVLG